MSGFADRFGGSGLTPSDVALAQYTLAANLATFWPPFANPLNVLARQLDVTPTFPSLAVALPDATLGSPGHNTIFRNKGIYPFLVTDFFGNTIYTIPVGQVVNIYLKDNTTQSGQWDGFILGSGVASLDLANAAGNGLFVSGSKLAVSPISSATSGNRTMGTTDVATSFVWTGGAGTFTLPVSTSLGQFFFEVRNQGSGALTLAATAPELIDQSSTVVLQINESAFVHAGVGFWYTVGRGRATQFSFTQLQKTVTGGTTTLSLTEAANVVQTYTGVLTQNETLVLPAVVQVYYISNQTTGTFNFQVRNPGAGTTVTIPTSQNAVLFSDGTNVINASTTTSGVAGLVLGSGSAPSPAMGVGASNTGIFSSGSNLVSISSNSVKVADFGTTGLTLNAPSATLAINAPSGNATVNMVRTVGNYASSSYYTSGNIRWQFGADNGAESGSDVGSNWFINSYTDAGALKFTPFSINRQTGVVSMPQGVTANVTGNLTGNATSANNATNATNATNASHAVSTSQLDGGYTPVSFMVRGTANAFSCNWNGSILYFGVDGNVFGGVMPMHISGNAATATSTNNLSGITGWSYANVGGTPVYAWSTNGATNQQFLTQPANWSVNFANTAGNANALGGIGTGGWVQNAGGLASLGLSGPNLINGALFWTATNVSDETTKENIAPTQEDSLAKIRRIDFKQFTFKDEFKIHGDGLQKLGPIAQQLQIIDPQWVQEMNGLLYPDLSPMLMAAIHSIAQLAEQNAALAERVSLLEKLK